MFFFLIENYKNEEPEIYSYAYTCILLISIMIQLIKKKKKIGLNQQQGLSIKIFFDPIFYKKNNLKHEFATLL